MSSELRPFHIAIPVHDLASARSFYGELLGCPEGRYNPHWVDFDFLGHQLVAHLRPPTENESTSPVEDLAVPVPHFGVVITKDEFDRIEALFRAADWPFLYPPRVRHEGQPGEQWTMFLKDPSGNTLEFKAMSDLDGLFRVHDQA